MTTVFYCDSDGVDKTFEAGEVPVVVGRAPECGIRSQDPLVSRYHAQIYVAEGQCCIQDLDSSNGVYIGGERVKRGVMPLDDVVLVGSIVMQVLPPEGQAAPLPRPSIHSRLWSWLKMERKARANAEEERNALGHRVGEMHQALDHMRQSMRAHMEGADEETRARLQEDAARKFAGELKRVRDSAKETRALLAAIEKEKAQLQQKLEESKREAASGTTKTTAELVGLQEENERLTEELSARTIEVDDLKAALRMKEEENAGLREDLAQLADAASPEAEKEQALAMAAQAETAKRKLADELAKVKAELEELRETADTDFELEISDLKEDLQAALEEKKSAQAEVRSLSDEIEALRWTQHEGHAEASRLKVQLEAALADVGELRGQGSVAAEESQTKLAAVERDRADLEDRVRRLSDELDAARAGAASGKADDVALRSELDRLRAETAEMRGRADALEAELAAARADAESAWAEVEAERSDGEAARKELESLRGSSSASAGESAKLEQDLAEARARAERANAELEAARTELGNARDDVVAARDEAEEARAEAADARAAAEAARGDAAAARSADRGADAGLAERAAEAERAKASLESRLESMSRELDELRKTCEMREQEREGLAGALRTARADADSAREQLQKALAESDAGATQPSAPAAGPAVSEHLVALEGFLGSLRRSMRAASDEAAVMPGEAESVGIVTDALTQATMDIENARDSLRALNDMLGE